MLVNFLLAYYGKDFDQCGWKPRELYMVLMVFFAEVGFAFELAKPRSLL